MIDTSTIIPKSNYPYEILDKAYSYFKKHEKYFRNIGFRILSVDWVRVNVYDFKFSKKYFYRLNLSYRGIGGFHSYTEAIAISKTYGFIINDEHILIDFDEKIYLQQEHLITATELGIL